MFALPWVVGCTGPSGPGPAADLDPVPAAHSGAPVVHSAVAHTGLVATGSTGMPSYECDLPAAVEVDGGPRVAIQDLRVAVIRQGTLGFGGTLQVIDDADGTPWLIAPGSSQVPYARIYGFRSPIVGLLHTDSDATGLVDYGDPYGYNWGHAAVIADFDRDGSPEGLFADQFSDLDLLPMPPAPGVSIRDPSQQMYVRLPRLVTVSTGDWDGDGIPDLGVGYDDGSYYESRVPYEPYPYSGMLVYRGPIDPSTLEVGVTPADAWYDTSGEDRWTAPDQRGSGAESQLVADFTGDGRADVVVDGQDWGEDMAYGGVVLFPGGTPGGHTAPGGGEGTVLYGACQEANPTNQMVVRPLGDVTGDGAVDLAVVGGRAQPAGERFPRGAVWVLSDVGSLRGPASLTSVATAIVEHRYGKGEAFVFAGRPADVTSVPDLDGNGVDELLLSDYYPGELYLFLGPVTGLLDVGQASLTIVGVDHPVTVGFGQPILATDLDGDGLAEIIVADQSAGEVTVISGARLRAALP